MPQAYTLSAPLRLQSRPLFTGLHHCHARCTGAKPTFHTARARVVTREANTGCMHAYPRVCPRHDVQDCSAFRSRRTQLTPPARTSRIGSKESTTRASGTPNDYSVVRWLGRHGNEKGPGLFGGLDLDLQATNLHTGAHRGSKASCMPSHLNLGLAILSGQHLNQVKMQARGVLYGQVHLPGSISGGTCIRLFKDKLRCCTTPWLLYNAMHLHNYKVATRPPNTAGLQLNIPGAGCLEGWSLKA